MSWFLTSLGQLYKICYDHLHKVPDAEAQTGPEQVLALLQKEESAENVVHINVQVQALTKKIQATDDLIRATQANISQVIEFMVTFCGLTELRFANLARSVVTLCFSLPGLQPWFDIDEKLLKDIKTIEGKMFDGNKLQSDGSPVVKVDAITAQQLHKEIGALLSQIRAMSEVDMPMAWCPGNLVFLAMQRDSLAAQAIYINAHIGGAESRDKWASVAKIELDSWAQLSLAWASEMN